MGISSTNNCNEDSACCNSIKFACVVFDLLITMVIITNTITQFVTLLISMYMTRHSSICSTGMGM